MANLFCVFWYTGMALQFMWVWMNPAKDILLRPCPRPGDSVSSAQHIPAGGACPADFLGRVLCLEMCFFLIGLKNEEEKQTPVWLVRPRQLLPPLLPSLCTAAFPLCTLSPSPLVWRLLKPFCPQHCPNFQLISFLNIFRDSRTGRSPRPSWTHWAARTPRAERREGTTR